MFTIPDRLTLSDALRIATERNPLLAAVRDDVEIAEAQRLDASRRLNPAVTIESEGYPLFTRTRPSFFNTQELTVRFDQEIETAGRRRLRVQAATDAIDAARSRVDDERRRLTLEVRRAYFGVVLAKADLEVGQAVLGEIARVIALTRARVDIGETSGAELRRLQVERLRFVDDVFAAELAKRNAEAALLGVLNAGALDQRFDVVEPLDSPMPVEGIGMTLLASGAGASMAALQSQATEHRPDLRAVVQEERRASTETRLQRALRTPNVTVGGGYRRDFGTNAVVFGVTIPLPIFNRNPGGIARADAERRRQQHLIEATTTTVLVELQQALNAGSTNLARVQYIENEYLTNARESRDIVRTSYELGAADLIDYLDAQRAFRDTRRTYNRALYDQRMSLFELEAALGLHTGQSSEVMR